MPIHQCLQDSTFDANLRGHHLMYEGAAQDGNSNPGNGDSGCGSKPSRINYAIHGDGPMAERISSQISEYQCIQPGEPWQCTAQGDECSARLGMISVVSGHHRARVLT